MSNRNDCPWGEPEPLKVSSDPASDLPKERSLYDALGPGPVPMSGARPAAPAKPAPVRLAPVKSEDEFFGDLGFPVDSPSFPGTIKLAPVGKPDFGPLGDVTELAEPETGLFRKGVRKFAVGDRVRLRRSPDGACCVIREVRPDGTLRCDEEGYPRGLGVSHVTSPESLIGA